MTSSPTLTALTSPGRGVFVADEYLAIGLQRLGAGRHGLTPEAFVDIALATAGISEPLAGALLSHSVFTRCSTRWRDQPVATSRHVALGVRVDARHTSADRSAPANPSADTERRLTSLREAGVTFVEWRSHIPPRAVQRGGTHVDTLALARGASASAHAGLVPVLTVAMPDLGSHNLVVARAVLTNALRSLVTELDRARVDPAGVVLRTSFAMAGDRHEAPTPADIVGTETAAMLAEALPAEVGGIAFVSGGQRAEAASVRLSTVAAAAAPRRVTFAFGRALVEASLSSWRMSPQPAALQRQFAADCRLAADATKAALVPGLA